MKPIPVLLALSAVLYPLRASAQQDTAAVRALMQRGAQLDRDGATAQARVTFQALIDSAATPAARAAAQRAMAMSYAFDGDCANTMKYEEMVIAYWQTREQADPQNAFAVMNLGETYAGQLAGAIRRFALRIPRAR